MSEAKIREQQPGEDEYERRSESIVEKQNTSENSNSAEDQDALEEEQLHRKARWLLKYFRKFLEQKHKQEEEMRNVPLFTRDDALYKLSGMAAHQQGERVQTSNLSNAPLTAAMNVDEMLERMNKEVREDVSKGYDQLCEKVRLVNAAFSSMDVEVQSVARQVYAKGTSKKEVIRTDGLVMGRTRVYEFLQKAESVMVDVLKEEQLL